MRIKKRQIREKIDTAKLQQNANKIVDVAGNVKNQFKSLGMDDEEAAGAVADMMDISSDGGMNEVVQGDKVVQFDSERTDETPFIINGIKWQYVNAIYPDGKKDIGVYRFDHDLTYDYQWFMDEVIPKPGTSMNEYNKEVMSKMKDQYGEKGGEKVYYATANKQDRDPETFELDEEDPGTGEDFGDIPTGRDIEAGASDYEEYQRLLQQMAKEEPQAELNYGEEPDNDLPFESVNPKMTKNQLVETVLGKKVRKVLRTIKKKDL